ncbi:Hypothetical predicted protein, partial [Paramuricea clavata]
LCITPLVFVYVIVTRAIPRYVNAMASVDLQEKANFARLSRLLVDKGTEALRSTLDAKHPPANLPAALNANKTSLLTLKVPVKRKPRVINDTQWDLLFPPSGNPPDSKLFDVTLLTVLLRNICGLPCPATGWDRMPNKGDRTVSANITRVKLFRNEVYAHVSSTRVDKTTFEYLWQEISQALVDLNIPQQEINDLKTGLLGPVEKNYVQIITEWISKDEDCKNMLEEFQKQLTQSNLQQHDLQQSMQHLEQVSQKTWDGVQELRQEVENWFTTENESRLLLITAGPGFGKSVFAAKRFKLKRSYDNAGVYHGLDESATDDLPKCVKLEMEEIRQQNPIIMTRILKSFLLLLQNRDCRETKRIIDKVNEAVSCLLFVSNGVVTVFHNSVYDWLLENGYERHEYTVKISNGKRRLWLICEQIFEEVKMEVSSSLDLKLTKEVTYALECGTGDILCMLSEVLHKSVLARSPEGLFTDDEKGIAKALVAKSPPCVKRISPLYSSKNENISCCTFTPDDSSVLYGKLETALNIAEKKEVSFWKGEDVKGVTFKFCAFSPSDLCAEDYEKNAEEDAYCVWNAITFQRVDQRSLFVSKLKKLEISPCEQLNRLCVLLNMAILLSLILRRLKTIFGYGFINMWNVDTCQMYQLFRDNVGTSEVACWWSDKDLFVCHIFDDILCLSKYPVDENFKIMITQGQLVEIFAEWTLLKFTMSTGLSTLHNDLKYAVICYTMSQKRRYAVINLDTRKMVTDDIQVVDAPDDMSTNVMKVFSTDTVVIVTVELIEKKTKVYVVENNMLMSADPELSKMEREVNPMQPLYQDVKICDLA